MDVPAQIMDVPAHFTPLFYGVPARSAPCDVGGTSICKLVFRHHQVSSKSKIFGVIMLFPPNVIHSQSRIFCEIIVRAYLGGMSMCKLVFRLHIFWVVGCLVGCLVGCVDVCRHHDNHCNQCR